MTVKNSSPLLRELAWRLKVVREQRQLTLQEVYDATGIHIGRIESSGINVTLLTLAALCKHYQVELATLVADLEHLAEETKP